MLLNTFCFLNYGRTEMFAQKKKDMLFIINLYLCRFKLKPTIILKLKRKNKIVKNIKLILSTSQTQNKFFLNSKC